MPCEQDSHSSSSETVYDADEEDNKPKRPFYSRKYFTQFVLPGFASVAFLIAGIIIYVLKPRLVSCVKSGHLLSSHSEDMPVIFNV